MEEIKIEFKELDEFTIDDTREVVIQEVPVYPELENLTITPSGEEQVFKHENSYGYDEVRVEAVPSEALEVNPTTENQEFNGMYSNVKVNAVTNEIDSNIVAENIKNDVEILGVKGNFTGEKYKPRYMSQSIRFQNYTGTELDHEVSMLDTTNFTNMSNMFGGCNNLTNLDLSEWNTNNVTNMNSMFLNCRSLTSLDLSSFDTSKVTDMFQMFSGCKSITELNLSNFDTSNVTGMGSMFQNCSSLTTLDLSSFDTENVTNMSQMFYGCTKLAYLDIRNFTFDKVTNYSNFVPYNFQKDCLIIVKGETEKEWVLARRSDLTNVKTVAELGE